MANLCFRSSGSLGGRLCAVGLSLSQRYRFRKIAGCAKRARTPWWGTACRACGLRAPVLPHHYPRGWSILQDALLASRGATGSLRRHCSVGVKPNLPPVDLIAAERARLGALIEEQCRKLIDWVEADHKKSGCSPPQACAALTMTVSRRLRRTN